jgi:hypothetical protein
MFGWGKSKKQLPEQGQVKVFLNPLVMLLAGRERQLGRPLKRAEVQAVVAEAAFVMMSPQQAKKFYASLDAEFPFPRIDPEHAWEEWQALRDEIQLG